MNHKEVRRFGRQPPRIPQELPGILTEFTKEVLRSQPVDLVQFSAKYFEAMASGDNNARFSSSKTDVDMIFDENRGHAITLAGCKDIYKKFHGQARIPYASLCQFWVANGYSSTQLRALFALGRQYGAPVDRDYFCALVCGTLEGTLRKTLIAYIDVATEQFEMRVVSFAKFEKVLKFLLKLHEDDDAVDSETICDHFRQLSEVQNGMIIDFNVAEADLPRLDAE